MGISRAYAQAAEPGNFFVAGKNNIINGAFDIWQRGTSIAGATSTSNYTADRWVGYRANTTISRQTTSDTTNLPFIQYAARVQRNSGQTFTTDVILATSLENADSTRFAGRTVTLSFYARAGANYSPTSSILVSAIGTGTGTDQNILAGFTGNVDYTQNNTLTTTWQRFTQTQAIPSSVTQIGTFFKMNPTGTAGANDWFEVTGVQLEIGSVATPFSRNAGTLAGELAACQRYYFELADATMVNGFGTRYNASTLYYSVPTPVELRNNPTVAYSGTVYYDGGGGGSASGTLSSPSTQAKRPGFVCLLASTSGTPTSGEAYVVTNGKHTFSSEL